MRTLLPKILALLFAVVIIHSCDTTVIDEGMETETADLKSASVDKVSYIVVLNDAELNTELPNLKGYEKKQEKVKAVSEKILKRAGVLDGELGFVYGTAIQGFSVKIPPGQLKKLESDPSVKYVEEDQIVTLDYSVEKDPGIEEVAPSGDELPYGIIRVHGGVEYQGSHVAWIIDTGIDFQNTDLNVDTEFDKSFVVGNLSADDDHGHGSHVSGILAAKANGDGIIGVAAGAKVVPVKVLDSNGSGYWSWIIAGVDYVAAKGSSGDVANMSLGGSFNSSVNAAVINASEMGIRFSIAAGNERTKASIKSPASAEGPNIYTISAMDINDRFAYFSNYGNPPIEYCAPGVSIRSYVADGSIESWSGTSMAAPHVGGLLLLGDIAIDGYVSGDRDKIPDPIAIAGGSTTNTPPTAVINGPYSGNEDSGVTFSAAGSADADGDGLSYTWDFGDGTTATTSNVTINHTYLWGTDFNVSLTVSDGKGGSDSKSTTATISEINDQPVANPGGPYSGISGQAVTLDASGSSDYDNVDGSTTNNQTLNYIWTFGDGTGTTTPSTTVTHSYATAGEYTVTLTVNDGIVNSNLVSTTASVSEQSANEAPTFTSWGVANTSNPATKRVQISWSVFDGNGDLATVTSTLKDPTLKTVSTTTIVSGSSASGIHDLSFKKGTSGNYTVTTIVTDQDGNSTTETETITL